MKQKTYLTAGGIRIERQSKRIPMHSALDSILRQIDIRKGAVFASSYEYPGRYDRNSIGFIDPPVELIGRAQTFALRALNKRGEQLLAMLYPTLASHPDLHAVQCGTHTIEGKINDRAAVPEEQSLRQPTIFSVVRAIVAHLGNPDEPHLGLYGAVGYDTAFQFDPLAEEYQQRPGDQRDIHLYLPDRLIIIDNQKEVAECVRYEFSQDGLTTIGLKRTGDHYPIQCSDPSEVRCDHETGVFAKKVQQIVDGTRRGDYFEVVLSQMFSQGFAGTPSALFDAMRRKNFSPYEFILGFGTEHLVGSSPEMFVRVEGRRVETCPISGTIRRGKDAIEDTAQMLKLLNSPKEAAELTMCTDVDRNDKSRVCEPGSVKVIGSRLIEKYRYLMHTVDHVEGLLLERCDGLDAFAAHLWACTLTGAPKPVARQTIEKMEHSPRGWYGGAVGMFRFNGSVNTGITIRTAHLKGGMAYVRAGSTILADSDPEAEEAETRLKAQGMLDTIQNLGASTPPIPVVFSKTGVGKRVLIVDNFDSFVHTLGSYFQQTGAQVTTYRAGFDWSLLDMVRPDLVVISPGPGTPREMGVPRLVGECVQRGLPVFGVCLGLQGIVEHFGGTLQTFAAPVHGKRSVICSTGRGILSGLPAEFTAGRYHSLYADPTTFPSCLAVTARTEDDTIMAIEHRELPITAVQFHPESLMTLGNDVGLRIVTNVMSRI